MSGVNVEATQLADWPSNGITKLLIVKASPHINILIIQASVLTSA